MTTLEELVQNSINLRPNTKRAYLAAVRDFIKFAGSRPQDWTGPAVEQWRNKRMTDGVTGQTIRANMYAVSFASHRWSALNGNDPRFNFAPYAELPRAGTPFRRPPLAVEQARDVVATCRDRPIDIRDRAVLILAFRTGMRCFSMSGIDIEDVKPDWRIEITLKGGKRYLLPPVDEEVREVFTELQEYMLQCGIDSGPLFRQMRRKRIDGSVPIGGRLGNNGIYTMMSQRGKLAGLPTFYPHICRHTFITLMRGYNVADHLIAAYTGHAVESRDVVSGYTGVAVAAQEMPTRLIPPLLRHRGAK